MMSKYEKQFKGRRINMEESTNLKLRLDELFQRWKTKAPSQGLSYHDEHVELPLTIDHQTKGFISDGVVCPETWISEKRKILFVLKEAYCDKTNGFDLVAELNKCGPWGGVWNRCVEWAYGIMAVSKDRPMTPYRSVDKEEANSYLKRVAVLNLKKSDGNSSSNMSEVEQYAGFDAKEIKEEIKIIDPDIVICGSVFYLLRTKVFDESLMGEGAFAGQWNDNWYYWTKSLTGRPTLIIDFYHPANRYPAVLNYYALMGIYYQAIRDRLRIESVGGVDWVADIT